MGVYPVGVEARLANGVRLMGYAVVFLLTKHIFAGVVSGIVRLLKPEIYRTTDAACHRGVVRHEATGCEEVHIDKRVT